MEPKRFERRILSSLAGDRQRLIACREQLAVHESDVSESQALYEWLLGRVNSLKKETTRPRRNTLYGSSVYQLRMSKSFLKIDREAVFSKQKDIARIESRIAQRTSRLEELRRKRSHQRGLHRMAS